MTKNIKECFPPILRIIILVSIVLVICEISLRLKFSDIFSTQKQIRDRSLHYEASIFARHVFAQKALYANGINSLWYINGKGYRGRYFDMEKKDRLFALYFMADLRFLIKFNPFRMIGLIELKKD